MTNQYIFEIDRNLNSEVLRKLFTQVDWAADRKTRDIEMMLSETTFQISAWNGNELIGFLRVLTDKAYRAFIEDVIVDYRFQSKGVGKKLIELALIELGQVNEIVLGCAEGNVSYYEQFGFERVSYAYMQKSLPKRSN